MHTRDRATANGAKSSAPSATTNGQTLKAPVSGIQVGAGPAFHLFLPGTSMIVRVNETGHLISEWYAAQLPVDCTDLTLGDQDPGTPGLQIDYGGGDQWRIGRAAMAFATAGRGDFRTPGLRLSDRAVLDFTYVSHRICDGALHLPGMPQARAEQNSRTLEITLRDSVEDLECILVWTIFPGSGCITRRTVVRNAGQRQVVITDLASVLIDLDVDNAEVITLDGTWLREAHAHRRPVGSQVVNTSQTGASSTEHNPGFLVVGEETTETSGWCYGFNLIYSGSHRSSIESSPGGNTRIVSGINGDGFAWPLEPGAEFHSPEAVMSFSDNGLGALSRQLHRFAQDCIVSPQWARTPRPVVINSWEATYFDYTHDSLLELADVGAEVGAEVFVVDDGWFGERYDDRTSLGDWEPNATRFPRGLEGFSSDLGCRGLRMGLWVEPEAISVDSNLYREHPEWAVTAAGRTPSEGRFELLLDLAQSDVRDYLVQAIGTIIDRAQASFVKWDLNRLITDATDPSFHHRYMLGLYDVLGRIFHARPDVLLETCSSGGNRFDLGMLAFGPQIWASDCTDPVERLSIQTGLSYLYPPASISAHISGSPNHQSGRVSSMAFRFAASAPFTLGIELDPRALQRAEFDELRQSIATYKSLREHVVKGTLWRLRQSGPFTSLAVVDDDRVLVADYTGMASPNAPRPHFCAPVSGEGRFSIAKVCTEQVEARGIPAAALRHGLPQRPTAVSLSGELRWVRPE